MDDMSDVMTDYSGERETLKRAVVKAAREGEPAGRVAAYYRSIFPRQLVEAKVEAEQFAQYVRTILTEAGILAEVSTTHGLWLEPAQVRLTLATGDDEDTAPRSLAPRARRVLGQHGITLARGDDAPETGTIDDLLIGEETVYLHQSRDT